MSLPADALDGYLGKIARTFSRHWGVEVIVGGAGGLRTDLLGMRIFVPETAASLADTDRAAFEGALDHEVGHVRREVDFPAGERPSDLMLTLTLPPEEVEGEEPSPPRPDAFRRHLFNLCEDVALEHDAGRKWHGCKVNLDALRAWACKDNREAFEAAVAAGGGFAPAIHLFGVGFFCRAMGTPEMAEWLPQDMAELLDAVGYLVEECAAAETPLDTLEVAKQLASILEEMADPPPEEEPSPAAEKVIRSLGEDAHAVGSTPIHRAVEKLSESARSAAMASKSRHIAHPSARAGDRVEVPALQPGSAAAFAFVREAASPYVGGVASRIVNLLRAPAPVRLSDRESGRIDSRALSGIRAGLKTPFTDEVKLPDLDAAVEILLDGSGSMYARVDVARQAAFVMGEALHRLRVPFEVLSWSEVDGVDPDSIPEEDRALYTRFESRAFKLYKSFDEPNWPHVAPRLLAYQAGGNNDDGGAVRDVARRLLGRKEKLKVLLVLSDGAPEHLGVDGKADGWGLINGHLKDTIRDAQRAGLRVGGFGICTEYVKEFYPQWAAVNRIEDMPAAATRLLGRLLKR